MCPRGLALIQARGKASPGSLSTCTCQVRQLPPALHRVLSKRGAGSTFWDSLLPRGSGLSQRVAFYLASAVKHSCHCHAVSQPGGGLPSANTDSSPETSTPGCIWLCDMLPCMEEFSVAKISAAMHADGVKTNATCKQISRLQC